MEIYSDIIAWSSNKSMFIRDAIRRLFGNETLSTQDIKEIKEILMGECGFDNIQISPKPVTESDIPAQTTNADSIIKIKEISQPHNISALSDRTPLAFSTDGLTIVYGKNGTGKSSYAKILKKVCWSRDKKVQLKKNVYNEDTDLQSVKLLFTKGDEECEFIWREGNEVDTRLNSVFVFDSKCAEIYLNKENPSEYKPVGINVLERLIELFTTLSESFDNDLLRLNKQKPQLPTTYNQTQINVWYQNIEKYQKKDIDSRLVVTEEEIKRKNELENSLKDSNLEQTNKALLHKKSRYKKIRDWVESVNKLFNGDSYNMIYNLMNDYVAKEKAFQLAQSSYKTDEEFSIGGQAWRNLWNAAREYATTEIKNTYPISSNNNGEFCILCHQPLSSEAKDRMQKFDLFIKDKTSLELQTTKDTISRKIEEYNAIPKEFISESLMEELKEDIPNIEEINSDYLQSLSKATDSVVCFLQRQAKDIQTYSLNVAIVELIDGILEQIDTKIKINEGIIKDKEKNQLEFYELDALCGLVDKREDILNYYDESVLRSKYDACKRLLTTRNVSNKIGELLESKAITAQKEIFDSYLKRLNPRIASNMELTKTHTSSGITYQKCKFSSIHENIVEVLSEGEQKMVAIANFLSESTINDSKNSLVFDDPINSLDLDYRESVANIIVELAKDRQVIVMTHDLYFLRLLYDLCKKNINEKFKLTCLNNVDGESGIVSDEIPYLVKNVQERIDSISKELTMLNSLDLSQIDMKNVLLNDLKDKMRQLLERTVEDILINKTVTRFSKNVNFKKGNLANIIVVEKEDIDYLLTLYGKYSEMIHDGSIETVPNKITEKDIKNDISEYKKWKKQFEDRAKDWKTNNDYR